MRKNVEGIISPSDGDGSPNVNPAVGQIVSQVNTADAESPPLAPQNDQNGEEVAEGRVDEERLEDERLKEGSEGGSEEEEMADVDVGANQEDNEDEDERDTKEEVEGEEGGRSRRKRARQGESKGEWRLKEKYTLDAKDLDQMNTLDAWWYEEEEAGLDADGEPCPSTEWTCFVCWYGRNKRADKPMQIKMRSIKEHAESSGHKRSLSYFNRRVASLKEAAQMTIEEVRAAEAYKIILSRDQRVRRWGRAARTIHQWRGPKMALWSPVRSSDASMPPCLSSVVISYSFPAWKAPSCLRRRERRALVAEATSSMPRR